MLTFSLNDKRLSEENHKILAGLTEKIKDPKTHYYKRYSISELIIDYLDNGTIPTEKKSYIFHGKRKEIDFIAGKSSKQIEDTKVAHLRLDRSENEEQIPLPDRNQFVEDQLESKEEREILFEIFKMVEAYFCNMNLSFFRVVDPLIDAELIYYNDINDYANPRLEKKFNHYIKNAVIMVEMYGDCLENLKPDPDDSNLSKGVIQYLEKNNLLRFMQDVLVDKTLWEKIRGSIKQEKVRK